MSEEKHKAYRLFLILAMMTCGFLLGIAAEGLYRDSLSEQDERAWKLVASDNIDENACIRVAAQSGKRRDVKFINWCLGEMAKVPHPKS